jgi:hypothetical protein
MTPDLLVALTPHLSVWWPGAPDPALADTACARRWPKPRRRTWPPPRGQRRGSYALRQRLWWRAAGPGRAERWCAWISALTGEAGTCLRGIVREPERIGGGMVSSPRRQRPNVSGVQSGRNLVAAPAQVCGCWVESTPERRESVEFGESQVAPTGKRLDPQACAGPARPPAGCWWALSSAAGLRASRGARSIVVALIAGKPALTRGASFRPRFVMRSRLPNPVQRTRRFHRAEP